MTVDITMTDKGALSVKGVGDPIELWSAMRNFFITRRPELRGTLAGSVGRKYPATTNGDVRQLAEVWRRVVRKIYRSDLGPLSDRKAKWDAQQTKIDRLLFAAFDDETFPENELFWLDWTYSHTGWLSAMRDQPSRWDLVVDALKHTVTSLPEALADRASGAAEAAASAAATVGLRAGEIAAAPARGIARGLFGSLATPLLIGAIVVGGIVIIPRVWPKDRPEGTS